jgi:hypothetical protein
VVTGVVVGVVVVGGVGVLGPPFTGSVMLNVPVAVPPSPAPLIEVIDIVFGPVMPAMLYVSGSEETIPPPPSGVDVTR